MEVWGGNQATDAAFDKAGIEIFLYSRPCGKNTDGGDVYYLSSCASGRITRMLLADVAGHGATVSRIASQLRNLMHRYINSIRPHRLFEDVNADFAQISTAERFATSVMSSYFMPTSTLSVCNAGHPMPLICRSGAHAWDVLEVECGGDDMPLGINETAEYTQLDIRLETGDLVLCYTDGVIESLDSDGRQLGVDGLRAMLNAIPTDRTEHILPELVRQIGVRTGGDPYDDDVTLLLYRTTDRVVPMRDTLAAPWRWLKSLFRARSPGR
jgi:serine phosphatase RsbU (regulator of sigma subunit)